MIARSFAASTFSVFLAQTGVSAPPSAPAGSVSIEIAGDGVKPGAVLDAAAWKRLPRATAQAVDPDKRSSIYEGARMADVLQDAGLMLGDALRGKLARVYVVVTASDNYEAVFSLGEIDTADARCAPILVNVRDGAPLAAEAGPVRVVAPCDRHHERWVRNVTALRVLTAAP